MKKLLLFSIVFLTLSVFISGCGTGNSGCKDTTAKNYKSSADKNCCCQYDADVVWWMTEATADTYRTDLGITTLTYTLDGVIIGTSTTDNFCAAEPVCGQEGAKNYSCVLDRKEPVVFAGEVKGDNGTIIWSGNVSVTANGCTKIEITL